ncbi:MAG: YgiQ family radical SAM protein [Thermodesulfobacteriota bacterium]
MMTPKANRPLPVTMAECLDRGWNKVDVVLVTGDAYIDHPSFGIALIGHLLEAEGLRVAILSQPAFDNPDDFRRFGRPRLFFGISGGNLDSIVANYSGNGKVRDRDAYSADGNPWRSSVRDKKNRRRPDRACLLYGNLARAAFKDSCIILGGIEASLRRFTHYDYKQEQLRGSLLTDAKADLLIYGMAERAVIEAAKRLSSGKNLDGIRGSCERLSPREFEARFLPDDEQLTRLPSYTEIKDDPEKFLEAEQIIDRKSRQYADTILVQKQQGGWLIQHPPAAPLNQSELDSLHELPYSRRPHPEANIPAYQMIRDSVTIVRGCPGNCSFCAISRHQGPAIISRSKKSILREIDAITRQPDFKGTISDLGGPTANLYLTSCKIGSCPRHDCLYPKVCPNLIIDEQGFIQLLKEASTRKGVKHLFVSSGLRMSLLLKTPTLLKTIIDHHTPGGLKIAPEHADDDLLVLMHKEPHSLLIEFIKTCRQIGRQLKRKIHFTPYLISAHPGSTVKEAENLGGRLKALGLRTNQFQDFTPSPGTLSTAMYVSGLHRDTSQPIHIPKGQAERSRQRKILETALKPRKSAKRHFSHK